VLEDYAQFGRRWISASNQFHLGRLTEPHRCSYLNSSKDLFIQSSTHYHIQSMTKLIAYSYVQGSQVWRYTGFQLDNGFPQSISELFPGAPHNRLHELWPQRNVPTRHVPTILRSRNLPNTTFAPTEKRPHANWPHKWPQESIVNFMTFLHRQGHASFA
jgi:hypothetical protein